MLAPDSRALLLDALRPPPGYQVDYCLATTFTLDLTTALTVPIALAGYDLTGEPDLMALLQALRSMADKFDVFCQAGMISSSSTPNDLVALLEHSIHQTQRPRRGSLFHPKVWVLRFDGASDRRYRCIVASRNLTADRSWDVMLRLDSDPTKTKVNPDNEDLVKLVRELPGLARIEAESPSANRIADLAEDLRRVAWELPDGATQLRFLAFGLKGRQHDTDDLFRGYRHLLISPFLTTGGVNRLVGSSPKSDVTIVSRADQYDQIAAADLAGHETWTLDPLASVGPDDDGPDIGGLRGNLHAKVFVIEQNRRSYIYIGSANATDAAFGGNVELLCEVSGGATALGVDRFIGKDAAFRSLLQPYALPEEPIPDDDAESVRRLEALLVDIAEVGFTANAIESSSLWSLQLTTAAPIPNPAGGLEVALHIAPYNVPNEQHVLDIGERIDITFPPRPGARLTPFFTIVATARIGVQEVSRSTVVCASLRGGPADRLDEIIVAQLDTPEKFLRFLMLLLTITDGFAVGVDATDGAGLGFWKSAESIGLLELLVCALAVNPAAIDRLSGIVERLTADERMSGVLPDGWVEIWPEVLAARKLSMRRRAR